MRYGISKATALDEHYLEKGQLISNLPSFLPQKTCMNPSFGAFSCTLRKKRRRKISVFEPYLEGVLWPNAFLETERRTRIARITRIILSNS